MISVEEAKSILVKNIFRTGKTELIKFNKCSGYILAEDIYSPIDLPQFDQSNVDGYALSNIDSESWKVISEIKAGDNVRLKLKKNTAAIIFTGAMIPTGSTCVVMQEYAVRNKNIVTVKDHKLTEGEFIRLKGSHIKKGELAIPEGTYISPAVTGFLSSMGILKVRVYCKPLIHIIITGNEIKHPGEKLSPGKIYDSNSYMLESLLKEMDLNASDILLAKDKKNQLKKVISDSLKKADVILISGGISVGKYDLVNETLEKLKVDKLFYRVNQRPGKPLYFGKKIKNKRFSYVFGLPGNPASVLTCFYEYVYPALRIISGYKNIFLKEVTLPAAEQILKSHAMGSFLKSKIMNSKAYPLDGQPSYIIKSFSEADGFIYLPSEKLKTGKNERVSVHLFPNTK